MSLQLIPCSTHSQTVDLATPINNDYMTMQESLSSYGDGRLLVTNVIETTDFILWTEGK